MIWITKARNILGRKIKLSNVGSVVTLTFGLSNLPSSDWHSHTYWGGCCTLKKPLCVVFLRMKMDMLESETRRLEALYGLKAKRPFYYCGTWCIMTLSALEVGHQKMCHECLLIIQSFLYNVCEICLKNTNFF